MKVAVLFEVRFCRVGDGSVWADEHSRRTAVPFLTVQLAAPSVARAVRS